MLENKNNYKGWLYLLPAIILLCIFTVYPLLNTTLIAFQKSYTYLDPFNYGALSFGNFTKVLQWSIFHTAVKNTFLIVFITVPLSTIISLGIALGLNSIKRFRKFFQTIFFLPYVTNAIAVGMVFTVLFSLDTIRGQEIPGVINAMLNLFGVESISFLTGTSYWAGMFVLLFYITWNGLAFKVLIFLSGLQGIDKQYYQAAQIDNASSSKTFFRITVPLLSPIISYVLITSLIGAFKEYTSVIAIFGADTQQSYDFGTIVSFIYRWKNGSTVSVAAAAAVILLIIILIFTAINMYVSKKKVHY